MSDRHARAIYVFVAALVVFTAWGGWLVFTNPDMTHARLMLTFWPHYLAQLTMLGVVTWWARKELRR